MIYKLSLKYLLGLSLLAFLAVPANRPQSLDDWKAALSAAQSGKGCESIPYGSYRDQCGRKSDKVDELCKTDSWSCDGLETKSVRETIIGLSGAIERLKAQIDQLKNQLSSAGSDTEKNEIEGKIKATQDQFDKKTEDLDGKKKGLETDLSEIDNRLYKGRQCLDARTDVQSVFASAISDAKRESDAEIKPIANQLIDYWERRAKEHEEAFRLVNQGLEKCNKCKSGDL
jgi:hypothetical protein